MKFYYTGTCVIQDLSTILFLHTIAESTDTAEGEGGNERVVIFHVLTTNFASVKEQNKLV